MRSVIRPESDHWKSDHIATLAAAVARHATAAADAAGDAASSVSSGNKRVRSQIADNNSATAGAAAAAVAAAAAAAASSTAAAAAARVTAAVTFPASAQTAQGDAATSGSDSIIEQMEIDTFRTVNNSSASDVLMSGEALPQFIADDGDANLDFSELFDGVSDEQWQSL
jgi:hypothetical protein